jgi:arabinose-5-phosphate isomerase
MQLALGDALAVALLEQRGFTPEEFRNFHPGGKLGARLKPVSAIMHQGERLPIVRESALMREAVAEMGSKGFGCVLVVADDGSLAGIVTDGDIRRNLSADMMSMPVAEAMTRQPKIIAPGMLLGEAIEFQERYKITVLIVAEGGKVLGLVHYLDLLRAGAA